MAKKKINVVLHHHINACIPITNSQNDLSKYPPQPLHSGAVHAQENMFVLAYCPKDMFNTKLIIIMTVGLLRPIGLRLFSLLLLLRSYFCQIKGQPYVCLFFPWWSLVYPDFPSFGGLIPVLIVLIPVD